jgi:hypothetical protein
VKPLLVTVTGHRTNTLKHQLNYYKDKIRDAFIVVYEHENSDNKVSEEINEIVKEFGFNIHTIRTHRPFDWAQITNIYNEIKMNYPNDWWIVSDDDELQVYWEPIEDIIKDCDKNGWQFVTGGFVDRIGDEGCFPEIKKDSNLWKLFPTACFFRYPMSGACPNKTVLCKGKIKVSNGQHYVLYNGTITWGRRAWSHPLRYPVYKEFVQVHHFKWDITVLQRLLDVAKVNNEYAYSHEYQKMYNMIEKSNFIIDVKNPIFLCEKIPFADYYAYKNWPKLKKQIIEI